MDDGHLIWKTPDISIYPYVGLTSTPIVYNGVAYVNTMSLSGNEIINCLYGFNAETGEQIVKIDGQAPDGYSGGAGMFSSPSMSPDGVLYVPGAGGVYAVDTATNAKLWEFDAGARSTAKQGSVTILGGNNMYVGSPVYKDQCVYFIRGGTVDEPTYFYCIDAITGKEIRKYEIYSSPITPVITDDKLITLGAILSDSSSMGGATAYNLTTGEMLWHSETGASSRASPIVAGDTVYFGTYKDGILYAVDIPTGEELWHSKFASASGATPGWWNIIEGTPAIEDGTLYIGAENGHFYAFKTPTLEDIGITAPANITAGTPAVFTGISPLEGTTYAWNFGDNTKGTGKTISKTWDTAGTYTVTLTAQCGGQSGSTVITVTVEQPPKQITEPVPAEIITPVGVTDEEKPAVTFDAGDKNETAGKITITISDYQSDADGAVNLGSITAPPDTEKLVVLLNLSVEGLKDQHKLNSYATLTVNISITDEDKTNLTFWRYADSLADGHLPELLKYTENTSLDAVDGWARFDIQVPGFSTIVGSIGSGQMSFAVIDPTGGGVTPTQNPVPSLNYISVNPGTGSFKYTTNHPDWPAVTFTINRMTAFGVLYASGANIIAAERWGGVYVDSINGLSPSTDTEGWMYQVNGNSPGVMANNYPVSIGDKVVWYYSEDMTKPVSQSKAVYAFIVGGIAPTPIIKNTGAVILSPDASFIEETASIPADTGLVNLTRTGILTEVQVPMEALKNITDASLHVVEGNRVELTLPVNISATDVFSILELSVLDSDQKEIQVNESGNFTFKCTVPSGKQLLVGHLNKTDVWENCTVIQTGDKLWTAEYDSLSTFAIFVINKGKEIPLVEKAKSEQTIEPTVEPTVNATTIKTTPLPTASRTPTPTAQSPAP
ncbi:MAG: PQQ-binding-like beta-propeller repeat protein, partial [Methanocorpusculum sp.]|nr:PQQ-binding-like beta-propeller repeat protein [Methanocorpusculum sp.]